MAQGVPDASGIPPTTREALLAAMARFDRDDRPTDRWLRWDGGQYGSHKYAVLHHGKRYPVRQIVSFATGLPVHTVPASTAPFDLLRNHGFALVQIRRDDGPHVWWVNQGQEYGPERAGGYIQAPVTNEKGHHYKHWDALTDVVEGDLFLHYRDGRIRAVGRARSHYQPVELADGRPGRRVPVEYADLTPSVPLDAVAARIHALNLPDGPLITDGSQPKQGYLWPFSPEGLQIVREASSAEWPFWSQPAAHEPRAWIFQADPSQFDTVAAVQDLSELSWPARQHASEMQPGDRVFLWVPGPDAGIVAVGTLLTSAEQMPPDADESQFLAHDHPQFEQQFRPQPRVRLRIEDVLVERLRRAELREHSVLRDLTIIQLGPGTNFKVTPDQAAALMALVVSQPPGAPPPPIPGSDGAPALQIDFSSLLQSMEQEGLHFAPELVANYLLALQTKRFAILTGISGTGKTKLALAIAQAFRPQVRVTASWGATAGAEAVTVQPYMLKYHRFVLPAALLTNLTLPRPEPESNSAHLKVEYPGGEQALRFYREPDRPVVVMLLSGPLRDWFERTFEVGETFHLDVVSRAADADGVDRLRISPPVTQVRTELLDNHRIIAVRPDWTDNRGLLGYHNPLAERYVSTPLLDLLLRAHAECERAAREGNRAPHPFFLILDEMNLAHVEHYFSDFLSAMESGAPIELHTDAALAEGKGADATPMPPQITIPPNVYFTGTVNMDETTSMFSPKVLDRAFTIELDQVDLAGYGLDTMMAASGVESVHTDDGGLSLGAFPGRLARWRQPSFEDWQQFAALQDGKFRATVVELHAMLARTHRHFGYRVANEIARFVALASEQADADADTLSAALDLALLQKVLPKFHGTQQELEEPLLALFGFFIQGTAVQVSQSATGGYSSTADPSAWTLVGGRLCHAPQSAAVGALADTADPSVSAAIISPAFPRSAAKVWRMLERLRQQGFTSFIE